MLVVRAQFYNASEVCAKVAFRKYVVFTISHQMERVGDFKRASILPRLAVALASFWSTNFLIELVEQNREVVNSMKVLKCDL